MQINEIKNNENVLNLNNEAKPLVCLLNGEVLFPSGEFRKADLLIQDKEIIAIDEIDQGNIPEFSEIQVVDAANKYITTGLVDQHMHGGYGCNFNTASEDEIMTLVKNLPKHGVVAILPTIMTDSIENIKIQIEKIKNVKKQLTDDCAQVIGIHLEGPFLNSKNKGIHPEDEILIPNLKNLATVIDDEIKIVTFAPELDENFEFTKFLTSKGIISSAGHTNASAELIKEGQKYGIKQVTHLFNAMPKLHHREANVTTEALVNDEIYTEIIPDCVHVHPKMIELVLKIKPKNKVIFISDCLPLAHSKSDSVIFGKQEIFKKDNQAVNKDGVMAGSIKFLSDSCPLLKQQLGLKFEDFITFASTNPAKNLGISDDFKIEIGKSPKIVLWDKLTFETQLI